MLRLLVRLLTLLLLILARTGPCEAHAALVAAMPPAGARLAALPASITLAFNEPVRAIRLQLRNTRGEIVAEGAEPGDDTELLALRPPADLPPGAYLVAWRVAGIDGHVISGGLPFVVGDEELVMAGDAEYGRASLTWPKSLARLLYLVGAIAGGGSVLALLTLRPDPRIELATRRLAMPALAIGTFAALGQIWLLGRELLAESPASLLDAAPFVAAISTGSGVSSLVGGSAMLLLLCLAGRQIRTLDRWIAGSALVALFSSFAASGHAATAWPRPAMGPLLVLHVAIGAFWLGALWPLLQVLGQARGADGSILERFGRIAIVVIPVLLLTAVVLLARQLQGGAILPASASASAWVAGALAKLAAVAGLLLVAARNRLVLVPAYRRGDAGAAASLRWLLRLDLALATLVLAATAVMATSQPPRLTPEAAVTRPLEVRAARAHVRLAMTLTSDRAGPSAMTVTVKDTEGKVIDAPEIWLLLEPGVEGIDAFRVELTRQESGAFRAEDLVLVPAGAWTFEAVVLVDDFSSVALQGEFRLR